MTLTDFDSSPNALFLTQVGAACRVSPGFVRVTLVGEDLVNLVPRGLDQRMKLLLPPGAMPGELTESMLPEREWRARWRALPHDERPVLRSYTVGDARPDAGELDIDFFVHDRAGPGSSWAIAATPGDHLVLSAPDRRRERGRHGVQFAPGIARNVLLVGDETAYPAIAGIWRAVAGYCNVGVIVEGGDPADVDAYFESSMRDRIQVVRRGFGEPGGAALVGELDRWCQQRGVEVAALGENFYAWCATESSRVSALRERLRVSGVDAAQVHVQGYWHDRARESS